MVSLMDKALMSMSLDEEDLEVNMPDLPEFCSNEQNAMSIIGRLLNPERQKMSSLILDMPRKWQKVGRVRGVALSKEKFQFIFNNIHDLDEVLEKGIQSYNEWSIVLEKWVEDPPPSYLQTVPIWVQIKNIPLNYYTERAITFLGDLAGQVTEVAFDPLKTQSKDYVRVKILFDVANPLIRKRIINLPKGGKEIVSYYYEKVQKRCYHCQRLTHEMAVCPILVKQRQELAMKRKEGIVNSLSPISPSLKVSDPLYGVLQERQVGVNPNTGRPRIAEEVLEGMRQYLVVADGEERKIREERVKKSVKEVEEDPMLEKTILRLEPPPIITTNLNKGKGLVFGYDTEDSVTQSDSPRPSNQKLMAASFRSATQTEVLSQADQSSSFGVYSEDWGDHGFSQIVSTVDGSDPFGTGSSGNFMEKLKTRKRPPKNKRKHSMPVLKSINEYYNPTANDAFNLLEKRKAKDKTEVQGRNAKQGTSNMVIPNEGSPNA